MENMIYVQLSNQLALDRRMNVLANNLANMNTAGFKSERPLFFEFIERIEGQEFRDRQQRRMAMINDYGTFVDFQQGGLSRTGNPLDLGLNGDGWFVIDGGNNEQLYTRNGRFQLDVDRRIVTGSGQALLDDNGNDIVVPDGVAQITVNDDGTVTTEDGLIATIDLVRFDRPDFMEQLGNSLFRTDEPPLPADGTEIKQFMLESSNVNTVLALTEMVDVQRSYQQAARASEQDHERIRSTIERLARPG